MMEHRVAFLGAGAIARVHAFALAGLKYYYPGTFKIERVAVSSSTPKAREAFAEKYDFLAAVPEAELWCNNDIDTVFILSPNEFHYTHLTKALNMSNVRRIYVEKPLSVTEEQEGPLSDCAERNDVMIQAGFQFLQMASVRAATTLFQEGAFGTPIHFHARYLHSGYLDHRYRTERLSRLRPAPEGGAIADLGSHALRFLNPHS